MSDRKATEGLLGTIHLRTILRDHTDVPSHEYLLLTDALLGPERVAAGAWPGAGRSSARHDGLGEVGYLHLPLREGPAGSVPAVSTANFSWRALWDQLVHILPGRLRVN